MDRLKDCRMDGLKDGRMDVLKDGRMVGCMFTVDEWLKGKTEGWMTPCW